MSDSFEFSRARNLLALIAFSTFLAACSGGGESEVAPDPVVAAPTGPTTGTVAIVLTDAATDHLAEINLDITEAILMGDAGKFTIFEGSTTINLLALENYGKPIA